MASRTPARTLNRTFAASTAEPSETYEERQRQYNAARVLESNEMLIWWSTMRNESIPQTRLHFENQLAGFTSDDSEPEWDDEPSGGPPPAGTPGVHVQFLFGENKRGAESSHAASMEQAYAATAGGAAAAGAGPPDMVALGGEHVERRLRGGSGSAVDVLDAAPASARRGRRSASGSGTGSSASGGNSPAGKTTGKKGRRSMGGGGEGASA